MASTFSQTLRLELIGDGDQSGIWGQTTNTNLGTLLEQAITGVVNITMLDANYTLTNFNGVSDEARNAVLVVGGTNSQVRDIIAPLVEKLYVVRNNTVGGFAINVRGSTGASVSVPSGATVWVYCDGTNFNAINTESVGNFEVNGNLTVTGNTNAVAATYTGNVAALNLSTANLSATGNVSATGNASATNFIGAGLTLTSINASNISAGTIANARTTGSSSNGASTIVLRDSNGSFAANVVTASAFSGGTIAGTTGTFSGNIQLNGAGGAFVTAATNGDLTASRSGGTSGAVYFGSSGTKYLFYDGTNYSMPGGQLDVNGQRVLNAGNFNSYAPTLTGTGASGTWTINVTGNAGSASSVAWGNISGRPYPTTSNWQYAGQAGQPTWLWGTNDGNNMYVWNPANFSVNYANTAGTATNANNATGTLASQVAKAWINFSGFPGEAFIRASFNVSSFNFFSTGNYEIYFASALPDANYVIASSVGNDIAGNIQGAARTGALAAGSFQLGVTTANGGAFTDNRQISAVVFR